MLNMLEEYLKFQAYGTSWLPFIRHGETILVQPGKFDDLKAGDFILYRSLQGNVIAGFPKKEITPQQLIGKIIAIQRKGKKIKTDSGLISLMRYAPRLTPSFHLLYKAGCKLLLFLQKSTLYRRLMRILFKDKVSYAVADEEEQEIASILACFGQSFLKLHNPLNSGSIKDQYIIAKMKNKIIGRLGLSGFSESFQGTFNSGWWLNSLYTKHRHRGMGIGEGLMQEALKTLKAKKAKEGHLMVRENNFTAIRLNEKLGFHRVEIPELDQKLKAKELPGKPRTIIMRCAL